MNLSKAYFIIITKERLCLRERVNDTDLGTNKQYITQLEESSTCQRQLSGQQCLAKCELQSQLRRNKN